MQAVSESLENYLETIFQICEQSQVARVKEVASRMKVTNASVVGALRELRKRGLASQERYGYISLTQKGRKLAQEVCNRHQALADFFQEVLGLSWLQAQQNACKAEHILEADTIARLILLKEFMETRDRFKETRLSKFKKFLREKER